MPFAGQTFGFGGDVTAQVSRTGLVRIGCAGPFPLLTTLDTTQAPYDRLYAEVGNRLFALDAAAAASTTARRLSRPSAILGPFPMVGTTRSVHAHRR